MFQNELPDEKRLSLIEHLDELRKRLIICVVSVLITTCAAYCFIKQILKLITQQIKTQLVFLAPTEAFITYFKVAIFCGIFLASPIILFQIWRFVASGLKKNEKRYLLVYAPFSFLLFIVGIFFAYSFIMPLAIDFLLGFAGDSLAPMISISKYVSFVSTLLLGFGFVFQLPIVILLLTQLGIVTTQFLHKKRKYMVLIAFIIGAVITPTPDIMTQSLMAGSLLILYEISIWLAVLVTYRKKNRKILGL